MNYRKMGRTGLKISSVSIGGWLTLGGSVGSEGSARILRRAVEHSAATKHVWHCLSRCTLSKTRSRIYA